jgi:hypothetical protein
MGLTDNALVPFGNFVAYLGNGVHLQSAFGQMLFIQRGVKRIGIATTHFIMAYNTWQYLSKGRQSLS